ncbi:MAG TPA: glycosyltransferase [Bryobacteraceae bacterium]|nr:glycosyltransferase [Bryobacteraceae bacterium]
MKSLTIGMATYDDYDGVYFTIQSIRLFHPDIADEVEFLVVDNHPDGRCTRDLQTLGNCCPNYRYIPYTRLNGTATRDVIFREASADFVLCVDCHVLFVPGSLRKLIDYFQTHPETPDLLQGPLLYDDLTSLSTHMDGKWSDGMYGVWANDPRAESPDAPPFEIAQQGLGAFACRKSSWPGLNPRLRGFGGEEGYLQEKFRRAGARTLCLPFLRWVHRFGRPLGVPYPNSWEDRIRNYMLIANELGNDPSPALAHFREHIGHQTADAIIASVCAELRNPFLFFDAIYCINLRDATVRWRDVTARFTQLGIAHLVRRFEGIRAPENSPNPNIGRALSHRAIIAEAKLHQFENVLIFEDDVRFTTDAIPGLQTALADIRQREWQLFYLGACRWHRETPLLQGALRLAEAGPATSVHSIAYHHSVFDRILNEVPATAEAMQPWLQAHHAIDQYFAFTLQTQKFLVTPVISTQPNIAPMESPDVRRRL